MVPRGSHGLAGNSVVSNTYFTYSTFIPFFVYIHTSTGYRHSSCIIMNTLQMIEHARHIKYIYCTLYLGISKSKNADNRIPPAFCATAYEIRQSREIVDPHIPIIISEGIYMPNPPIPPCLAAASPCIFSLTLMLTSKNLETQRSRQTDSPLLSSPSRYSGGMHFWVQDCVRLEVDGLSVNRHRNY